MQNTSQITIAGANIKAILKLFVFAMVYFVVACIYIYIYIYIYYPPWCISWSPWSALFMTVTDPFVSDAENAAAGTVIVPSAPVVCFPTAAGFGLHYIIIL